MPYIKYNSILNSILTIQYLHSLGEKVHMNTSESLMMASFKPNDWCVINIFASDVKQRSNHICHFGWQKGNT